MEGVDLVLIEFDNHCLLCRKEECYERMLSFYEEMSVSLTCNTLCTCTPEEYSFIVETLGGRAHHRHKKKEICNDLQKIVEFYRIKERLSDAGLRGQCCTPTRCRRQGNACWVIYNVLTKRSIVSDCLDVPSFYPEFTVVDTVPNTAEARSFFQNKPWKDRERLLQKVLAFVVLFT